MSKRRPETLAIHAGQESPDPATGARAEQEATGVTEDYIRLSIGLEDVIDIKEDIDQVLKAAAQEVK
jgi:O-acetylhomoserine (thiol)-lyase